MNVLIVKYFIEPIFVNNVQCIMYIVHSLSPNGWLHIWNVYTKNARIRYTQSARAVVAVSSISFTICPNSYNFSAIIVEPLLFIYCTLCLNNHVWFGEHPYLCVLTHPHCLIASDIWLVENFCVGCFATDST